MRTFIVVLVHHPVRDSSGDAVTTAITNLDIHDLARSARTYGAAEYVLVHPIDAQRELVGRVRDHWLTGSSGRRIPARKKAIELVRTVRSLEELIESLGGRKKIEIWTTAARAHGAVTSFGDARRRLEEEGPPVLLLFGTGWGLTNTTLEDADVAIEPIVAARDTDYNHLSVRAACAIALDRLLGARAPVG